MPPAHPLAEPGPFRPTPLQRALLDRFQRDLPLVPRPYAAMAAAVGGERGGGRRGPRRVAGCGGCWRGSA